MELSGPFTRAPAATGRGIWRCGAGGTRYARREKTDLIKVRIERYMYRCTSIPVIDDASQLLPMNGAQVRLCSFKLPIAIQGCLSRGSWKMQLHVCNFSAIEVHQGQNALRYNSTCVCMYLYLIASDLAVPETIVSRQENEIWGQTHVGGAVKRASLSDVGKGVVRRPAGVAWGAQNLELAPSLGLPLGRGLLDAGILVSQEFVHHGQRMPLKSHLALPYLVSRALGKVV
ncbi:hypothetical protein QBC44DRAFT_398204 [Cladorrhinum sp. PSN332]|nr:hypothetical protein QBC44DRAFT_398204 [Cladorrhinum sp. PSN332]